jgi:hypothetical protein
VLFSYISKDIENLSLLWRSDKENLNEMSGDLP